MRLLRYLMLLALLGTIWAFTVFKFPLAVSRSEPGSRSQEKWHGHKTFEGRLSEAGMCDLTPRTASPERIGESSGSSGSGCAAPGGRTSQRTGRCVSQSLRVGSGERARGAILCDTHSVPSAKKKHSTNTTTRGYTAQAHCTLVLLPHVRTVSLIHSFIQQCHSARAARARTSDTRDTSHAVHLKAPFLKRHCDVSLAPPPPAFLSSRVVYDLFVDGMSYVAQSTSSSVSSGRAALDVLWERALSALPPELLSALRAAELDDPRVLSEYPVESLHDLEEYMVGKVEIGAPSGAASTTHSPLSSSHSCSLQTGPSGSGSSWTADVAVTGKGGDPRNDHFLLLV